MTTDVDMETRDNRNLIVGIILIGVGVVFLLSNFFHFHLNNWWALFILIPAFIAFNDAWKIYSKNGKQLTKDVKNRIMGGIFPLIVAVIFLFNISWSVVWPIFIILIGIAMLVG
ncbi:hypothetical protein KC799_05255 [candidate division KSB1 bacterium]|nr:hypothetical protein [candidate division KSB1 bacterium]